MKTPLDDDLGKVYEAFRQDHDRLRQTLMGLVIPRSIRHKQISRFGYAKEFIGGTIMRSRITKLATAAAIVIAVLIGISQLGGSIDSRVFASMLEEMQKVTWVHAVMEGDGPDERGESWISFDPPIMILAGPDGMVMYVNFRQEVSYVYDRKTNRITVSTVPDTFSTMGPKTAFDLINPLWIRQRPRERRSPERRPSRTACRLR